MARLAEACSTSRSRRGARVRWLAALALALSAGRLAAQDVSVARSGDALKIRTERAGFLNAESLERLKNGRTVRVELQVAALPKRGALPLVQRRQVFIVSYDLWEERFAVTPAGARGPGISHLTSSGAESWCVEQITLPVTALGAGRDAPFWIRLEYRILDGDAAAGADEDGSGFTLQGLIESLSRKRKPEASAGSFEAGPFTLPR